MVKKSNWSNLVPHQDTRGRRDNWPLILYISGRPIWFEITLGGTLSLEKCFLVSFLRSSSSTKTGSQFLPLVTRTLLGENVGSRVSAPETLPPRPNPIPMREHGSRFFETTNFFHFKGGEGGAGNWSVRPRRRDEILGRCLPSRSIENRCPPPRCIERTKRIIVLEWKFLNISTVLSTSKIEESILLGKWNSRLDDWNIISLWGSYVDLFASFTGYYSDI